jgi:tripeptidyl-peptidase-1
MLYSLVVLFQLLAASTAPVSDHLAAIEERFGPIKVHSRAQESHIAAVKRSFDTEEPSSYSLKLHAHDQDTVNDLIAELSNPDHQRYGQWLSLEEAHEITK